MQSSTLFPRHSVRLLYLFSKIQRSSEQPPYIPPLLHTRFLAVFHAAVLSLLGLGRNGITIIPLGNSPAEEPEHLVMEEHKLTVLPPQLLELPILRLLNVRRNTMDKDDPVVKQLQKNGSRSFFR